MPYIIKIKGGIATVPKLINFGTSFNFATPSSPIKITDRWIWSYNAEIVEGDDWGNYFKWNH
jgi:hypothetical protein